MNLRGPLLDLPPSQQWELGVTCFEGGDYYDAHEHWEAIWKDLPISPLKDRLKGLIMVAGALHLIGLGRIPPAHRLAKRIDELWAGDFLPPVDLVEFRRRLGT